MVELNELGVEVDFPPARLKQPHGEPACTVLNTLCDQALSREGFEFGDPNYPEERYGAGQHRRPPLQWSPPALTHPLLPQP